MPLCLVSHAECHDAEYCYAECRGARKYDDQHSSYYVERKVYCRLDLVVLCQQVPRLM
jgi:hypothetical protein